MQEIQTFLDYAAIAPIITALVLFVGYIAKRAIADLRPTIAPLPTVPTVPTVPAVGKARRKSTADAQFINELLAIAPSPAPTEPPHDAALVPLAKLYAVPGSSKWAASRKLRQSERQRVLSAIAA